ncbi:A-kinase anchor protein 13 isoform X2 [Boleophthalmus pectinirostris]|uniref:A-kinase anchor protein 13 isoform X2 n=1 Tax=Boleophthalmus pectinirostris TaxID=150288 RepID=UPI00243145E1|nr:A-kinase anchor protein 13 isoform X2 [Boleophthalmus pectinirostris]
MKLSPQQAPLYGRCVITVQLTDEELAVAEEKHKFFLLFSGSTKRHLTSTHRSGHDTLQALCPAHDCCEAVLVTLCSISPASEDWVGHVTPLAEHRFCFVQDLAFDMAQFLVSTAGRTDGLEGALLLDECHIPLRECERLDDSLALALHHLILPPGWSLLGSKLSNSTDLDPQETLLHFSARRGLFQVTQFLLQQPGAKEALRLTNRQGYTPSAIAALKGHDCLQELLIRAEKDIETCNQTETVQLVSTDAQLVCHLPRLSTHTLTLSIVPGRDPPSIQRSVEQLLHLICHLHAKGVSTLELQFDSLHTAAECCEDIETEITSVERLHTATAPECLDKRKQGSGNENCSAGSSQSIADCGHDENGNSERDWSLCGGTPEVEKPEEPGLSPSLNWVCRAANAGSDYQRAEEEGRQWPASSTQSLCDRSGTHEETVCVGTVPPAACGKQGEDTDTRNTGIQEGQEATERRERSEQEAEHSRDRTHGTEETELAELITSSEATTASPMGLSPSTECSDMSDTSDCELKDKEEEDTGEPNVREEEKEDTKELTDFSCASEDQSPPLTDCNDVIAVCDSAFPPLLIEGLHEGEPPPHTNSLEQNQETAGRDYALEQQWGLTPETGCHSGNCTGISTGEEYVQCTEDTSAEIVHVIQSTDVPTEELNHLEETSVSDFQTDIFLGPCQIVPNTGVTPHAHVELEMIHVTSSDDDASFQSVGSSTTDIFHPTDQARTEGQGLRTEERLAEKSCDIDSLTVGVELPSESAIVNTRTVPDCSQTGTGPGHQLSPSSHTMKPLIVEAKEGELSPNPSTEELLEEPQAENWVSSAIKADDSQNAFNSSDKNVFTDNSTSEVEHVSLAPTLAVSNCDIKALQNCETTAYEIKDTNMTNEELPHSGNTTILSMPSDGLDDISTRTFSAQLNSSVTSVPDREEGLLTHSLDCVDGASELQDSPTQDVEDNVADDEGNDAAVENTSLIHRDREATCGPCNALQSESPQTFVLPTHSATSCPSTNHRDSGSDLESFITAESGYDGVLRKSDEAVTGGDSASEVSVSCSSTDDTASIGPSSSSPEGSQGLGHCHWSPEERLKAGPNTSDSIAGEAEEEAKDRVTEVPRRSCLLRNSRRSISPLRRHSWGPGKNYTGGVEMNRSYSLEGLSGVQGELRGSSRQSPQILEPSGTHNNDSDERGSLMSLTEEPEERVQLRRLDKKKSQRYLPMRNSCPPMTLPLTKSVSMLAISNRDIDGMRPFSCTAGSLAYSISEEEPGPLRTDMEEKNLTKVGRTFSYLKSKMYKKTREKEREKKEKEGKEKDKKSTNGHVFSSVCLSQSSQCSQCNKTFTSKEAYLCAYCNASVHKGCRDSLPVCSKVKMKLPKQQLTLPDSSSFPTVTMRNKTGATRERPWSAILSPEDHSSLMIPSRRQTALMFHGNNLSKSLSISNIAGPVFDEMPIRTLRYLSQSTDSLNRTNQVTESMESLTDEGTEMMDGQLMGEFEADAKELEADSWSLGVDQHFLQQLGKDLVKRQDIIYELMQTEMHHIRTLRILSEVYSKGLQKEVQLEAHTLDRLFPALDELLDLHTQYLLRLLERKRGCQQEGGSTDGAVIIHSIGDIVLSQFSGPNGESMKRVYGKFCSCHNEAVNFYKDLLTKDKRFKTFIKKKMSSSIVRRLGIPECILLVTQRITKYPVLVQRLLQHTKEGSEDFEDLTEALRLVKEVIAAVDEKVNEHEKRQRLKDFHSRMDTKSIMMMKSGQIFAREDLLRRRLIHDGPLQLKNSQGRLKEVHALLLSDVFVFLHEKDQKYVFAMLDQRSTVISLQKLIVREVANEERGLFLITAGIEKPEMMEVLASSKDERNSWMQKIQEAMQSMDKDEDEGIPSETEDDKRQLETKAREMRDLLRQKDTEILSLLEQKVRLFRGMWEGLSSAEESSRQVGPFFRSDSSQEPPRGTAIMKDALQEVETLQTLVNGSLGGAMASIQEGGGVGPVCLPRRAETFGGFDSHQMLSSKSGDKDENLETAGDLRRTESDSVLKKGGNANLLLMLKRNSEVLRSVSNLHLLLSSLQAVVVQQDSFIEDQRQALSERSSSSLSLSRPSSRPSSLIEQEKQRSLEKQRQELASLQRQQAAHADEKRRKEREWEQREQHLSDREALMHVQEEEILQQHNKLEQEKQELQNRKEEYQRDLERLRDAQRKLERDREAVQRQLHRMDELRLAERTPSTTSDESQLLGSSQSLELDPLDFSSVPRQQPQRQSKSKGKGLNPFTSSSNSSCKNSDANNQLSRSLLQLTKNKGKEGKDKDKKKKKSKGTPSADGQHLQEGPLDGEIFFC